jgi:hypothetical protein
MECCNFTNSDSKFLTFRATVSDNYALERYQQPDFKFAIARLAAMRHRTPLEVVLPIEFLIPGLDRFGTDDVVWTEFLQIRLQILSGGG